ncbi:MAG: hypothetical protein K8R21_05140 [Leptospira sp.]|nr:hypothetical protein [Leptospira sp.]
MHIPGKVTGWCESPGSPSSTASARSLTQKQTEFEQIFHWVRATRRSSDNFFIRSVAKIHSFLLEKNYVPKTKILLAYSVGVPANFKEIEKKFIPMEKMFA